MRSGRSWFAALLVSFLACLWLGIGLEQYWLGVVPFGLFALYQVLTDFRPIFYLLLFFIPLSTEVYLPGGLGTDLPTEPLMLGLTGIFILHAALHWPRYPARFYAHPIALMLYAHVAWIFLTTLLSDGWLVSIKFSLAKLWYVGAFFLLPGLLIRSPRDVRRMGWIIFWPLLFVAFQSVLRHAGYGFSFADQYKTLSPFMRNHVAYAGILAVFAPWLVWLTLGTEAKSWRRWFFYGCWLFWLIAVYFSYTRAAYISLVLAAGSFLIIRWRLMLPALLAALCGGLILVGYLLRDNTYLEYAPNYETTVAHERFDNLIEATYKLEDISTMERAYRWVAGGNMIPYRPWFGWGPGNFVNFYKGYTVSSFTTYVSDNPERSGIHSYFLMTLVEQGWPGLFLLLVFLGVILLNAERAFHRQRDPARRSAIMAATLSTVVVYAFLIINDMLETDKMGSFFFLNLVVIIAMQAGGSASDHSQPQQEDAAAG